MFIKKKLFFHIPVKFKGYPYKKKIFIYLDKLQQNILSFQSKVE